MAIFYEWAMQRQIRDTPNGDFLKDLRGDKDAASVANTKAAWESHLDMLSACDGAKKAFRALWAAYNRS